MSDFYGPQHRLLQQAFNSVSLADRVSELIVLPEISPEHQGFIESRDFFFLTTVDHRGYPSCSYKGGNVGLVKVIDNHTLAFPIYDGNGMFLSAGNIGNNSKVGLLFIDFETPHRLRVHGDASIDMQDPLLSTFQEANLVVRVDVCEIFINCPRYIHQYQRLESSKYVPQSGCTTPPPQWKRIDALQDVLSEHDQAVVSQLGGVISPDEYGELVMKGKG